MSLAVALFTAGLASAALTQPPAESPNARPHAPCDAAALQRTAEFFRVELKRLDELPPAAHHLTVMRMVEGCAIATVRFGGRNYWAPVGPPGRVMPLDALSRKR